MSVPAASKRTVRIKDAGGNEIAYLDGSVSINKQQNGRDTCRFAVKATDATAAPLDVGDEITIEAVAPDASVVTIYAGSVENRTVSDRGTGENVSLQLVYDCVDHNRICDRRRVAEVYENETLADIAADLVTSYLSDDGVTAGAIATGPTIDKIPFNYAPVSVALDELSELTGYMWNVGYDKALSIFERSGNAAPFALSDAGLKRYTTMSVRSSRGEYRNVQYVRAGHGLTDTQIETFAGDGQRITFTVGYPIGRVPTVEIDTGSGFVAQTVGIQQLETGKDWYWNKDRKELVQDENGTVLGTTDRLRVTYQGLYPIITRSQSDSEIAARQAIEGGSGLYEHVVDDQNIDKSQIALDKAAGLLRRWATIDQVVEFETRWPGLEAGQLLSIDIAKLGLSGAFLLDSVSVRVNERREGVFSVRALSGEQVGGWQAFWKRQTQAGRKFVVRENEVLEILRTLEDTLQLSDELTVTEHDPQTEFVVGTAVVGFSEVL